MPTQKTDRKSGFGPRPHGIYSHRDKHGSPCIAVTTARKGKKGGGKRLKVLSGQDRNIVYPYLSSILRDHTGQHFAFDAEVMPDEYHTVSESVAIQMLLLMDAVKQEPRYERACAMAQAIAAMNTCEAAWWRAHHNLKHRPRKVMKALALMYV